MKVYETADIRNVALLGHQGSGKTMLAEAMLLNSGAINRMGSIEDGSTQSDYHAPEQQRQMSIFSSLLHAEWEGKKINVLDAPGYPDFVGEVSASLRVADAALMVLHAVDGVQVGSDLAWGYCTADKVPTAIILNQADRAGIDFAALIEEVHEHFGRSATPVQFPVGGGSLAIVDLLLMKQLEYPEGGGKAKLVDIDGAHKDRAEELRNTLVENIAENDEALMEQYLENGELSEAELTAGLKSAMIERQLFPIFLCSATGNVGVDRLMSAIGANFPGPADMPPMPTDEGEPVVCDPAGETIGFVFRSMSEPHVGEYSMIRMAAGSIEQGAELENAQTRAGERLGNLFVLNGRNRTNVAKLVAGDVGATVKLKDTHTNNTLRAKGSDVVVSPIVFPEIRYAAAVRAANAGEEDKLSAGLQKTMAEDPSLRLIHDTDLNQVILGGQGEMQLEIAKGRLKERYGVDVVLTIPKVSYRETIQATSRASYRHKKQTGGAGQFADVSLQVEPLDGDFKPPADIKVRGTTEATTSWGAKLEMIDAIVSGVIDMRRFGGAIQKGIVEAMERGPIAGYPVGDVRVVVYDGKMHSVDSNEAAFKMAGRQCFREAFQKAQPVMLEPIFDLEVTVPDAYTGEVMSDLNTRRARIQGMQADGPLQKVVAAAPEAELLRYSTVLRSLTQGRGLHSARFNSYEPIPRQVQDKIVEEARKEQEQE
ncbi:MAG: elongation factor G [Deltaproteobacteria bacterium]|jgi:elongation factor G|nr:elongation factor G [Deltaproteobacteria bacterium]MBW2536140.1 elongation factor G [Deltaproteobacteria bacterium]